MKEKQRNIQAICSLVLGIIALIWGFFLIGGAIVSSIIGIIAIVMGILARRKEGGAVMATIGIVLGAICIILTILMFIVAYS